jgi:hypothetical protein
LSPSFSISLHFFLVLLPQFFLYFTVYLLPSHFFSVLLNSIHISFDCTHSLTLVFVFLLFQPILVAFIISLIPQLPLQFLFLLEIPQISIFLGFCQLLLHQPVFHSLYSLILFLLYSFCLFQ